MPANIDGFVSDVPDRLALQVPAGDGGTPEVTPEYFSPAPCVGESGLDVYVELPWHGGQLTKAIRPSPRWRPGHGALHRHGSALLALSCSPPYLCGLRVHPLSSISANRSFAHVFCGIRSPRDERPRTRPPRCRSHEVRLRQFVYLVYRRI